MFPKVTRRFALRVVIGVALFANIAMAGLFVSHEFFNFTSSNSALYILRGRTGGVEIKRDLFFEDADRLIFMFDANCIYNYFMRGLAIAKNAPLLEVTWDRGRGVGDIKQFRGDGSMLSLSLSRFVEDSGEPRGVFVGGDLPYGDISRSKDQSTSGFGFYDGKDWHHIWCAANEGFNISGTKLTVVPPLWEYKGSRVLKNTQDEVMLESDHEMELDGNRMKMKRFASFKAGNDYFVLKIKFTNASVNPVSYGFAYGDEPWVGKFGASEGDVGWHEGGLVKHEAFVSPVKHSYAGYWDTGNDAANEEKVYTGYANFIQWIEPAPSYVFFSNNFDSCCADNVPLFAKYNRIINIVWLNQILMPGESKSHVLAIGMAKEDPQTGFPVKPEVVIN